MRDDYDFSKSTKNPYAKKLKKQVTIRLDEDTIEYFKDLAEKKDLRKRPAITPCQAEAGVQL
ncbi:MAG: antitoxin [Alcanivorax sp.]|nr:antitoxin [Alcanivorax sp.]MAY09235.1 antitoxin [Alcanivorax sp.]